MSDWKDKIPGGVRGYAPHHASGKTAVVDQNGQQWLEDPNNPGQPVKIEDGKAGAPSTSLDLPADDSLAVKLDRAQSTEKTPGRKFDAPETVIRAKAPMPKKKK